MYGDPVFDEVSVVIFRYGDPGDDSLDLHMNYVLAISGQVRLFIVHFPNTDMTYGFMSSDMSICGQSHVDLILMTRL